MKKAMYGSVHGILMVLDMIAVILPFPWEYGDNLKRKMKGKMDGKK